MERSRLGTLVALLLCFALGACDLVRGETVDGSGVQDRQTVDVTGFTEVIFSVPGELRIEQGPTEGLHMEGDDNILERLLIRVRNNRLEIGTEDRVTLRPGLPLTFRLQMPELTGVNLAGDGRIDVSEFQVDDLTVRVAGSGSVSTPDLAAASLRVDLAGSGRFEAWGTAERQDLRVAGSGRIDVAELESGEARVDIAGSGDVHLRASSTLNARIAGSGNVRYSGDPELSTTIAGSGTVRPAN